jgi:porphobilinogen synthase
MSFPKYRPRRMRRTENLRRLVREHRLSTDCLVAPLFVREGRGIKNPIESLQGQFHFSPDTVVEEAEAFYQLGVPAICLFGIPEEKDEEARSAWDEHGVVQQAVRVIKQAVPDLVVVTDTCLCEYTSHGHCGIVRDGEIDNDLSLGLLSKVALSQAHAGADLVSPSDMMDGRVGAIRESLDREGFTQIGIISYVAKVASSFYAPFRDAAQSAPQFGDRRSYQMDAANSDEMIREIRQDIEEGVDVLMMKPAMGYLDLIYRAKQEFGYPIACYNVSGEYAMVKAASERGWLDEKKVVLESLTGMVRAGANMIFTYWAKDVARWLNEETLKERVLQT